MSDSVLLADDHPVDPDDELLVAYLDDELDDEQRKAVEKRLVAEVEFQRRLQSLETGWEWLNELPNESTNEKLVESTIELAVEDLVPRRKSKPSWLRQHWRSLTFAGVLAGSFIAGAAGTRVEKKLALSRDLEELAIAENHEAYRLGNHFAFYRQLAYNERWQVMIDAMEKIGRREMAPPSVVPSLPVQNRDEAIQSLPTETREKLLGRWEAYNGYDEETKNEMRQIAKDVRAADDSEKLLRTMKAASVWLEDLSEEVRDKLQSDDEQIRATAINDAIDFTLSNLALDSGRLINNQTSDQIYLWLQVLLERRLEQDQDLQEMYQRSIDSALQSGGQTEWVDYWFARMILRDFRRPPGGGPGFGGGMRFGPGFTSAMRPTEDREAPAPPPPGTDDSTRDPGRRGPPMKFPPPISDEEYAELRQLLGAKASADLVALTSLSSELLDNDVDPINATLRIWAIEAVRRNSPVFDSDETPLDRYRDRENPDEFDLLPPEEIMNEVYLRPNRRGRLIGWPAPR